MAAKDGRKTMCVAVVRSPTRRTAQCIAQTNIMYVSERGIKQDLEKDSIHMAMRAKMLSADRVRLEAALQTQQHIKSCLIVWEGGRVSSLQKLVRWPIVSWDGW